MTVGNGNISGDEGGGLGAEGHCVVVVGGGGGGALGGDGCCMAEGSGNTSGGGGLTWAGGIAGLSSSHLLICRVLKP